MRETFALGFHNHLNSRLTRKGLGFSESVAMHRAAAAWEDLYYNFAYPVKTLQVELFDELRKRWEPCTPAMAAEFTLHVWTPEELLTTVIAYRA